MYARVWAHLKRRHEYYWAPCAYLLALVFIYRRIFFPSNGQVGLGWDTIEAYWADLAFLSDQLRVGDAALWNPFERAGYPDFAVPERGIYYPPNWLFSIVGVFLGETPWWLAQCKGLFHHLVAGGTLHIFLRSRGLPPAAGLLGGLTWMASAPMLIHKASSVIWPLAWLPLVWLAIDKLLERPSPRRSAGLAAALVLTAHAGSTPGFFYCLLAAFAYGSWRLVCATLDHREQTLRFLGRVGAYLAIAVGLAVAMSLVLYLPTAELTAQSTRAQRSIGYALSFPLPPRDALLGLLAPNVGKYDAFVGIAALTLAIIAIVATPRRDRFLPVFAMALAAFFLVLSFGGATPLLEWLVGHVPGFGLFRAANRYKLLAVPLLAVAAGYGTAALLDPNPRLVRTRVALALVGVLIAWAVFGHDAPKGVPLPSATLPLWTLAATVACVVVTLVVPTRLRNAIPFLMAPLIVFEAQHHVHVRNPALERKVDHLEDRVWLEGLADVRTQYRIFDEFVLEQRAGTRLRIREFRGYPAGASLEPTRYSDTIAYAKKYPHILSALNIRYIFHGAHHRAGTAPNHFKRPPDALAPRHFRRLDTAGCRNKKRMPCPIFEGTYTAPVVAWYGAVATADDATRTYDLLREDIEVKGSLQRAVVSRRDFENIPTETLPTPSPDPVEGKLLSFSSQNVVASVMAPAPGIVVLNEAMYPGWNVTVDGKPAEPLWVNWLVRGVFVGPGQHDIAWSFGPRGYWLYHGLWSLGFFVIVGAAVWPRKRRYSMPYLSSL